MYSWTEAAVVSSDPIFDSYRFTPLAPYRDLTHWFIWALYATAETGFLLVFRSRSNWSGGPLVEHAIHTLPEITSEGARVMAMDYQVRLSGVSLRAFLNGNSVVAFVLAAPMIADWGISRNSLRDAIARLKDKKNYDPYVKFLISSAGLTLVTLLVCLWLPWLLGTRATLDGIIEMLQLTACTSLSITWAFYCLNFINFERWSRMFEKRLVSAGLSRYVRKTGAYGAVKGRKLSRLGLALQPWLAQVGFAGCIVLASLGPVLDLPREHTFGKLMLAYSPCLVALLFWIALKLAWERYTFAQLFSLEGFEGFMRFSNTDEDFDRFHTILQAIDAKS